MRSSFKKKNLIYKKNGQKIFFTGPKAIESIVCILVDRFRSAVFVITAFFSTNVLPATDQNFKCLTPADTNCVSEFGRNNARNIRSSDATEHAILIPTNRKIKD